MTGLHKDVVDNRWREGVQRFVKRIDPAAPDEGDTNGFYRLTTEPHGEADCPFKDGPDVPMTEYLTLEEVIGDAD